MVAPIIPVKKAPSQKDNLAQDTGHTCLELGQEARSIHGQRHKRALVRIGQAALIADGAAAVLAQQINTQVAAERTYERGVDRHGNRQRIMQRAAAQEGAFISYEPM